MAKQKIVNSMLLAMALGLGQPAWCQANDLELMSLNTYCFPALKRDLLKFLLKTDLVSGVDTPILTRIDKIAKFAIAKNPDVFFCQELWGEENKQKMISGLKPKFKYIFWNDENKPKDPSYMDDGLLIASQRLPFMERKIIYSARTGDEDAGILQGGAQKGALIIGVYDTKGKAILLINTHLQSGTGKDEVATRMNQYRQLAAELKSIQANDPRTRDAQIILAGDVNDPVSWREENKRLVDRTRQMQDVLKQAGYPLTNSWLMKLMIERYKPNDVAQIYEIERRAVFTTANGSVRHEITASGANPYKVSKIVTQSEGVAMGAKASGPDDDVAGRLNGNDHRWSFFPEATDPIGNQILDHVFVLDSRSEVKNFRVFRAECLGDRPGLGVIPKDQRWAGRTIHFDGKVAIADHAAIMVTISAR